jgi:glycosyltransferase involved in cell wall biosynthesis
MRILCLTKYTERGPSSRYRLLQFLPYLEARGIHADIQALHDDAYLDRLFRGEPAGAVYLARRFATRLAALFHAKRYDLVFIQKEVFPWVPGFAESVLHRSGVPMVLDIDDAIHLPYENRRLLSRKFPRLIAKCAMVLAGNGYLRDYALQFNPRSVLFPTVVDDARITPGPPRSHEQPVVGWIGSPASVVELQRLAPVLDRAYGRAPFRMLVVGADNPGVSQVPFDSVPWSEETEAGHLRAMDVGIMPLTLSEWSRGKCALKLLQYMSAGVATVSSPTASAPDIIVPGVNGAIATNEDDWEREVTALVGNSAARADIGASARRWLESHYTLSNYGPLFARYLEAAATGGEVPDGLDTAGG